MLEKSIKCPYCGADATGQNQDDLIHKFVTCPSCGRYEYRDFPATIGTEIKDKIASYLYYTSKVEEHADYRFYNFIGSKEAYEKQCSQYPWCHYASIAEIEAFYPKTFAERIDRILLGFAKLSEYIGGIITIKYDSLISAFFIKRYDKNGRALDQKNIGLQLEQVLEYLKQKNYIDVGTIAIETQIQLLPDGWVRIDELQKEPSNNKNVFISMAFNDGTKDTREALRGGIINAGYSPEFIDEIIHNKQIVPEMFRLIRECRFLILDISDPNYGAYYEAGYALGLGKEVIICCSQEAFNKTLPEEEKKYEKYLRPHFDIAQKQILVWDNYEDLTKKLEEWIKAIIG